MHEIFFIFIIFMYDLCFQITWNSTDDSVLMWVSICYSSKNEIFPLILLKIHHKEAVNDKPKGCNTSSLSLLISR